MLDLAERGRVPLFGQGNASTNPIADEDLAVVAADQLLAPAPLVARELELGGPDILSRRRIAELACEAAGRGRVMSLPLGLGRLMALLMRPLSPRMSDLVRFVLAVGETDAIAPTVGKRSLAESYALAMAQRRGARSLPA